MNKKTYRESLTRMKLSGYNCVQTVELTDFERVTGNNFRVLSGEVVYWFAFTVERIDGKWYAWRHTSNNPIACEISEADAGKLKITRAMHDSAGYWYYHPTAREDEINEVLQVGDLVYREWNGPNPTWAQFEVVEIDDDVTTLRATQDSDQGWKTGDIHIALNDEIWWNEQDQEWKC